MADDQSEPPSKAQSIPALTTGRLASSVSKLSGSSRALPSNQDFHFYNNFDEFRVPVVQIAGESQSMLESVGSSALLRGKETSAAAAFPEDLDDAYDRLVDVNDAILERFDASVEEFRRVRKKEEEPQAGRVAEDGFQLVLGKKKKAAGQFQSGNGDGRKDSDPASDVKVATKDKKTAGPKPKVPFHIPTIRRPQEEFNIFVNNVNQPFEHVWLQRTEDGQRVVHPLEKLSVLDFVDHDIPHVESLKPPSVECTSFKFVEDVKDLKELAAKLRAVNEFAVDLEHNQYRSFQGLTCLIQISTRTEDFVIDALKLRIHIGPYLREVFKDPTKRKVMHGADRDIVWLQRDFGIYICNLFDTGQASRILKLERNSLEYLLHHFCGVTANKEYQNADWRLRPLPEEMLRYARDDTHYLLHIYDLMRVELFSMLKESESVKDSLLEVYQRSYDICMQLYEKELLTEDSYLYIYGLQGAGLNSQQLAIVAGLCEWRDVIARAEDESTGYILPNKTLIEIAKQMPVTTSKLRRLVKSKHPYVEHNLGSVVSIVRNSMQTAAAFEAAAERLKNGTVGKVSEQNLVLNEEPEVGKTAIASEESTSAKAGSTSALSSTSHALGLRCIPPKFEKDGLGGSSVQPGETGNEKIDGYVPLVLKDNLGASEQRKDLSTSPFADSGEVNGATVEVQKKPSRAFGALLGNTITNKKFDLGEKVKQEVKLKQIRASVQFPLHSFSNMGEQSKPVGKVPVAALEAPLSDVSTAISPANSKLNDMSMLQVDTDIDELRNGDLETTKDADNDLKVSASDIDRDAPMSLSDLSLSFQQCLQSVTANRKAIEGDKAHGSVGLQLKPFDYAAARKQIVFGDVSKHVAEGGDKGERILHDSKGNKISDGAGPAKDNETAEFSQGRRRKAFPATGNRSATFR